MSAGTAIRRPDMPFSANEGSPLPGCCAWATIEELNGVLRRLSAWFPQEPIGLDGVVDAIRDFFEELPAWKGARLQFTTAAPAKKVHFVFGYEIPERYAVLMAALRADSREAFLGHFKFSGGGVSRAIVGDAGAGVNASVPATNSTTPS